jgi:hypothetical protein
MKLLADKIMIARTFDLICEPNATYELRAPKAGRFKTLSGYYIHPCAKMVADAASIADDFGAPGTYITINPVKSALLARGDHRIVKYAEHTTGDGEIGARKILPIDLDASRPAGISSSAEEHGAAIMRGGKVRNYLTELGWPEPILADSGNGCHLCYRIELANDPEAAELVRRVLVALDARFGDEAVHVDLKCFNASRIFKLWGTPARKGDSVADRPHRLSKILEAPADAEHFLVVPRHLLEQVAAEAQAKVPPAGKPVSSGVLGSINGAFDMEAFISNHSIEVKNRRTKPDGTLQWDLKVCPFDPDEPNIGNAAIFQKPDGTLGFNCQRDRCADNHWRQFRELFEPVTEYVYRDGNGTAVYKMMVQSNAKWLALPDGTTGKGCMRGIDRMLYNLDKIRRDAAAPVIVTGSERHADELMASGRLATTFCTDYWHDSYSVSLKGHPVMLYVGADGLSDAAAVAARDGLKRNPTGRSCSIKFNLDGVYEHGTNDKA